MGEQAGGLAGQAVASQSLSNRKTRQVRRENWDKLESGEGLGPSLAERQQSAQPAQQQAEAARQAQTAAMSQMLRSGGGGQGKALQGQKGIAQGAAMAQSQATMQANIEGQRLAEARRRQFLEQERQQAAQNLQTGQQVGATAGDLAEQGAKKIGGADFAGASQSVYGN